MKIQIKIIISLLIILFFMVIWQITHGYIKDKNMHAIKNTLNSKELIEKSVGIVLPDNSVIENYKYFESGGYYFAKIQINIKYKKGIEDQLFSYFGELPDIGNGVFPDFKKLIDWWDLKETDVDKRYLKIITGGIIPDKVTILTNEEWVFSTNEVNGHFYLYISGSALEVLYPKVYIELSGTAYDTSETWPNGSIRQKHYLKRQ